MSNSNPNTWIIVASPSGNNPLTYSFHVELEGEVMDAGYEFLWDFGDGNESEFPQPTHTYSSAAAYDVNVNIVEEGGGKGDGDKKTVSDPPPPPPAGSVLLTLNAS